MRAILFTDLVGSTTTAAGEPEGLLEGEARTLTINPERSKQ
jgi:hypothetical protein